MHFFFILVALVLRHNQGAVLFNGTALNSTGLSLVLVYGLPEQEAGLKDHVTTEKNLEQALPPRPKKSHPRDSWLFYLKSSPSGA